MYAPSAYNIRKGHQSKLSNSNSKAVARRI